jgi:SAM-dependent methyltransferase
MALTERLGTLLRLEPASRVLDIAAGRGTSAVHLARVFGCQVVGIDYSSRNVSAAQATAQDEGLADRVQFLEADAERLTEFDDESFDAVVCECAYCTFADKAAAAAEIVRVLRPGGRFGLSDVTCRGPLPSELNGLLAWIACVADALSVDDYIAGLAAAGLYVDCVERHDQALGELVRQVRGRLVGADVLVKLGQLQLPGIDLEGATRMARCAAEAVQTGALGYSLITATRPRRPKVTAWTA